MRYWRDVVGFEDRYEVSNDGIIMSKEITLQCGIGRSRKKKRKELKPGESYSGHLGVVLCSPSKRIFTGIHRILLTAFVRSPLPGEVARHKDGNCKNNKLENLEWGTIKDNAKDSIDHGVQPVGERCGNSKLKEEDVLKIRKLRKDGETYISIAHKYNITRQNVMNICKLSTWKHI